METRVILLPQILPKKQQATFIINSTNRLLNHNVPKIKAAARSCRKMVTPKRQHDRIATSRNMARRAEARKS
jgi:hypothetical protein